MKISTNLTSPIHVTSIKSVLLIQLHFEWTISCKSIIFLQVFLIIMDITKKIELLNTLILLFLCFLVIILFFIFANLNANV